MSKIEVRKSLENWSKEVKRKIEERIRTTDTIDTGALLKSIKYEYPKYSGSNKEWFVEFSMLDYGKYLDDKPNPRVKKQPVPPRHFFEKVIEDMSEQKLEEYLYEEIFLDIQKKLQPKK
jgi:hypothetical protein